MIKLLLLAALLVVISPSLSWAQAPDLSDAHARLTYWWLATPRVVHDSLAAQKHWREASFGDVVPTMGSEKTEAFISEDGAVVRLFTFYQGRLAKQSFLVSPGGIDHHNMQAWFERCYALPDGRRLDREFGLVLTRKFVNESTMFSLEPDWQDEEANKLAK